MKSIIAHLCVTVPTSPTLTHRMVGVVTVTPSSCLTTPPTVLLTIALFSSSYNTKDVTVCYMVQHGASVSND